MKLPQKYIDLQKILKNIFKTCCTLRSHTTHTTHPSIHEYFVARRHRWYQVRTDGPPPHLRPPVLAWYQLYAISDVINLNPVGPLEISYHLTDNLINEVFRVAVIIMPAQITCGNILNNLLFVNYDYIIEFIFIKCFLSQQI